MTEGSWIILASNALTLLTAAFGLLMGFKNADKIQEVHLTVNSRLTEFRDQTEKLLLASVVAAHADGTAEGIAETKAQIAAMPNSSKN